MIIFLWMSLVRIQKKKIFNNKTQNTYGFSFGFLKVNLFRFWFRLQILKYYIKIIIHLSGVLPVNTAGIFIFVSTNYTKRLILICEIDLR